MAREDVAGFELAGIKNLIDRAVDGETSEAHLLLVSFAAARLHRALIEVRAVLPTLTPSTAQAVAAAIERGLIGGR